MADSIGHAASGNSRKRPKQHGDHDEPVADTGVNLSTLQTTRTDEELSDLIAKVACVAISNDVRIIKRVETTAGEIASKVAATVAAETATKEVRKLSQAERQQAQGLQDPICSICNKHLDKFRKLVDRKEKVAEMKLCTAKMEVKKELRGEMENLRLGPNAGGTI